MSAYDALAEHVFKTLADARDPWDTLQLLTTWARARRALGVEARAYAQWVDAVTQRTLGSEWTTVTVTEADDPLAELAFDLVDDSLSSRSAVDLDLVGLFPVTTSPADDVPAAECDAAFREWSRTLASPIAAATWLADLRGGVASACREDGMRLAVMADLGEIVLARMHAPPGDPAHLPTVAGLSEACAPVIEFAAMQACDLAGVALAPSVGTPPPIDRAARRSPEDRPPVR